MAIKYIDPFTTTLRDDKGRRTGPACQKIGVGEIKSRKAEGIVSEVKSDLDTLKKTSPLLMSIKAPMSLMFYMHRLTR